MQGLIRKIKGFFPVTIAEAVFVNGTNKNIKSYIDESNAIYTNVKKFGAKGDGIEDDTIHVQDAIDSCKAGGTVFLPFGVYKITAPLLVHSNQIIVGDNATILQGAQLNNLMRNYSNKEVGILYGATNNVKIFNLTFDGGEYTTSNTLLGFSHSSNILISGCIFRNGFGNWHDIEINSTKWATIEKCIFEKSKRTSNLAEQIQVDSFNNYATWPWEDGVADGTVSYMIDIKECHFECNDISPAIGNHSEAAVENIRIFDNTFDGAKSARGTICFKSSKNVMVHNNMFERCTLPLGSTVNNNNNMSDGIIIN